MLNQQQLESIFFKYGMILNGYRETILKLLNGCDLSVCTAAIVLVKQVPGRPIHLESSFVTCNYDRD